MKANKTIAAGKAATKALATAAQAKREAAAAVKLKQEAEIELSMLKAQLGMLGGAKPRPEITSDATSA